MSTRWYPLYNKGNPQLRIFLPNFWMKLIKPDRNRPPNVVLFQTSTGMTKYDVKNYLEKIYNVPTVEVDVEMRQGKTRKPRHKGYIVKDDDYKVAIVTLPREEKFEFPNLFPEEKADDTRTMDQARKAITQFSRRNAHRPGVPGWFSF